MSHAAQSSKSRAVRERPSGTSYSSYSRSVTSQEFLGGCPYRGRLSSLSSQPRKAIRQPSSPSATRNTTMDVQDKDQLESSNPDTDGDDEIEERTPSPRAIKGPFLDTQVGRFLFELRPVLLGPRDRGKKLPSGTKVPGPFNGTFIAFRAWCSRITWRLTPPLFPRIKSRSRPWELF